MGGGVSLVRDTQHMDRTGGGTYGAGAGSGSLALATRFTADARRVVVDSPLRGAEVTAVRRMPTVRMIDFDNIIEVCWWQDALKRLRLGRGRGRDAGSSVSYILWLTSQRSLGVQRIHSAAPHDQQEQLCEHADTSERWTWTPARERIA